MAETQNYTTLKSKIQAWCMDQSVGLSNQLDAIINQATQRLDRSLNTEYSEVTTTGSFVTGTATLSKPSNSERLQTQAIVVTNGTAVTVLRKQPRDWIDAMFNDNSHTGVPAYYCDLSATQWRVAATPAGTYSYSISSRQPFTVPDSSNATPLLVVAHWDLLFAACMSEAADYKRDEVLKQRWETATDRLLNDANERYWDMHGRDTARIAAARAANQPAA